MEYKMLFIDDQKIVTEGVLTSKNVWTTKFVLFVMYFTDLDCLERCAQEGFIGLTHWSLANSSCNAYVLNMCLPKIGKDQPFHGLHQMGCQCLWSVAVVILSVC